MVPWMLPQTLTVCFVQAKPAAAPERAVEHVAAAVFDDASVDVPEVPPPAVVPAAAFAAPPPPNAAPHAPLVDISAPYSPPAAGDDSDSEFELHMPRVKQAKAKVAKPKPSAPKAKAPEVVEPTMPPAAAAPVPAAVAPAPERSALAPVSSNVPQPPAATAAKPRAPALPGGVKKRKLLDVSTAVDTVPPAFLFGLMGGGGFTAPKLKPAF